MSDFGTLLVVTSGATESIINEFENKLEEICDENDLFDAIGEKFNFECEFLDNEIICRLSDHYYSENREEDREFIEEEEGSFYTIIISNLKDYFPNLEISIGLENW